MVTRVTALLSLFAVLVGFQPEWLRPEWSELGVWLTSVPAEEAVAGLLRLAAIAGLATQVFGLALVWLGSMVGSGAMVRMARRMLLPMLRAAVPLAVAAGPAVPALASDPGLPVFPPPITRVVSESQTPPSVVVTNGDSMWKIAVEHASGDVGMYWRKVVELNRPRFDDVDLIHPGDVVVLPGSGQQADPDPTNPVVDVGVDNDDRLPGAEGQSTTNDRNGDRGSDPGSQNVVSPVAGRTVPMVPPVVGG